MGMQRIYGLSDEQTLAVYLYSKEKDQEWSVSAPVISLIINTVHQAAARLHDIASDFSRYVNKDHVLAECFDAARTALNGGIDETV